MAAGSFDLYLKWDLNPHGRNGQGILSPSCLPIPPFRHSVRISAAKILLFENILAISSFFLENMLKHEKLCQMLKYPKIVL